MKKFFVLAGLLTGLVSFIYAADSSSSNATITADVSRAQLAMASSEYLVTAGDIYTIVVRGNSYSLTIDASYKLRVASLGVINVRGLTFQELKGKVETLISNNFPTDNIQFYITNPATFKVIVKGEVKKASEVETWSLGRLNDIISPYYTDYSTVRNIKIISENGSEKVVDLYKSERYGDITQNPYLRPGDTIIVGKYDRRVEVSGCVKRPGTYDLQEGENYTELIMNYCDGYSEDVDKENILLKRFIGGKNVWSSQKLGDAEILGNMNIYNRDKIVVGNLSLLRPFIYVEGAISLPSNGSITGPSDIRRECLNYEEGETYEDFVRAHRDFFVNNSADLQHSYIRRGAITGINTQDITNTDITNSTEETISENTKQYDEQGHEIINVDLSKILFEKNNYGELLVEPGDTLYVPYTQYFVLVSGAVISPGRYPYQADKDWSYYVNLANGFNQDQNIFSAVTIKTKDGKKLSKKSKIPPEAVIHAQRNSPNQGWVIPLIISIITFLSTCLGFYNTITDLFK